MSDHWKTLLHEDSLKQLEGNNDLVRQATEAGKGMLESNVTNRDLELLAQEKRVNELTILEIQQHISGEAQPPKTQAEPEQPDPKENFDPTAARAADHEQSELEARLEREKPDEVKDAELEAQYRDSLKDPADAPANDKTSDAAAKQREEEERQRQEQERDRDDD